MIDASEFFEKHLPYKTRILLAHYKMTDGGKREWTADTGQLDACFVASLVTARLYLNFLGLGKSKGVLAPYPHDPNSDDVSVTDLGGVALTLNDLKPGEDTLFYNFIVMADKAAAHITKPKPHDWSVTHDVIQRIHGYLQTNLYTPAGRIGLESLT